MKYDAVFELHYSLMSERKKPMAEQFNLPIVLDGEKVLHDCKFTLKDRAKLEPGDCGTAFVSFLRPETLKGKLEQGSTFGLWDRTLIGYGKVLELCLK